MASSSTSSVPKSFKYDVFLSFRGADTRKNFVDHLYSALQQQNISTYKDDEEIEKGKRIKDELMGSIEDSKYFIIVFSKNYASSSWCLDELLKIMEFQKTTTEHTVYPVFYDVEPTEVRNQTGVVGDAFARHEKKEAAGEWRKALKEAADVAGWELKNTFDGHEVKFVRQIVEKLSLELRAINFRIDDKLVGMETRIHDIVLSLETASDAVRMIGIWGIGGGGKTTLARVVFDQMSFHFEGKSFVENVREVSNSHLSGLKSLQRQILSNVLDNHDINVDSVSEGKNMMSRMMRGRKMLLVLDDVDHLDQLDALAGDTSWFKPGSIIILTTREQQVLVAHGVKLIQNVNLLSDEEALWLFNRYAFRKEIPKGYEELSRQVVSYAAGLPLTIKVLGSSLCGKIRPEWVDALARLKTIPLKETQQKLELSYTSLADDYKEIFLDVATILKGWEKHSAIQALESCGFHAIIGLRDLEQKSLITFYNDKGYKKVGMHDHIEEMGRNIVRRLHKHSRLWDNKEIAYILANDSGTEATKCVQFSRWKLDLEPFMNGLRKMTELRFLDVVEHDSYDETEIYRFSPPLPESLQYLRWINSSTKYLPKTFQANNLVGVVMVNNNMVQFWEGEERKVLPNLRFLVLAGRNLRSFDLRLTPNLETLQLGQVGSVVRLYMTVECLRLKSLRLKCVTLRKFDLGLTPNLENLFLKCSDLVQLHMPLRCLKLRSLYLRKSKLTTLDVGLTPNLELLFVQNCNNLKEFHISDECVKLRFLHLKRLKLRTFDLGPSPNLEWFNLLKCNDLEEFYFAECPVLRDIQISGSKLRTLDLKLVPNFSKFTSKCQDLEELNLPSRCLNLKKLSLTDSKLRTIDIGLAPVLTNLQFQNCYDLEELHLDNQCQNLVVLYISNSKLRTLDLGLMPNLENLYLNECYDLEELHLDNQCQKLVILDIIVSKLRTLDLGLKPNLENLYLKECYHMEELHMDNQCQNLVVLYISNSKLRTLDLGLIPNLKNLHLKECYDLEELHLDNQCQKLVILEIIDSKLRTLDLGLKRNLENLYLEECYHLEELHMDNQCENLVVLYISNSKLRTLDLGLMPDLEKLHLKECYDLEELHLDNQCQKLVILDIMDSKLRTLDLGLKPNLENLYLTECYHLEELHMDNQFQNLVVVHISNSKLRTLDLGLMPNLENLHLNECYDLEELHLDNQCQKLVILDIIVSKLRTLDLGLKPNLENLYLEECYHLEELHMDNQCENLVVLYISNSKLRTLDLGLIPDLEKLHLKECYDLEELHLDNQCQKLVILDIMDSKLRTLDLGLKPNLENLYLKECYHLEELHMDNQCQNLVVLHISNSKLRTLDLGLMPNLENLYIRECYDLEELHLDNQCQKLVILDTSDSKLRTLDLSMMPNLEKLYLNGWYNLVELLDAISCLKNLIDLNLSGCLGFESFSFQIKENTCGRTYESLEVRPLSKLYFTLKVCPFHPDNHLYKFESECFHKEDLPSLTTSIEKLLLARPCACTELERFSQIVHSLQDAGDFDEDSDIESGSKTSENSSDTESGSEPSDEYSSYKESGSVTSENSC